MDDDSRYDDASHSHLDAEEQRRREGSSPFDEDDSPIPLESTPITDEFIKEVQKEIEERPEGVVDAELELNGIPEDSSLRDH